MCFLWAISNAKKKNKLIRIVIEICHGEAFFGGQDNLVLIYSGWINNFMS